MSMPKYRVTYAENREDLVLAGILRTVGVGFYVDLGANHPESQSVTKIFYDRGWSGINVEPHEHLIRELCHQRPRDINIQAGVSSQPGTLRLRSYGIDGLATFSWDMKGIYGMLHPDSEHWDKPVEVLNLAEILRKHRPTGDIHFLKADVEGLELEVLLGNAWDHFRPWVLCLERGLYRARQEAITTFLAACNYTHFFHDGLNDFYVAIERRDLADNFFYSRDVLAEGIPVHATMIPYLSAAAAPPTELTTQPETAVRATHVRELLALDREGFVSAAYATFLNRAPDCDGLRNYLAELSAGASKLAVLSRIRNSPEGRRHGVSLAGFRWAVLTTRLRVKARSP
jgi:FkbM family methyltransferase